MVFRTLFRLEVKGAANIPADGPVIVASNHSSYIDAIILGLLSPRQIRFMAKGELWRYPLLGRLVEALGAFPIRRGKSDRQAIHTAVSVLREGDVVGIFPEGTRFHDEKLGPGQAGVVLLAVKGDAPVVPVGIRGTERVMPPGAKIPRLPKIVVEAGSPIDVVHERSEGDRRRALAEIMAKIAELSRKETAD